MTIIAAVPYVVLVLGALAYLLAGRPEVKEIGRIAFAMALLVVMLLLAGRVLTLGG